MDRRYEERAHDALGDLPPVDYAQLHSTAEDSKNVSGPLDGEAYGSC
ncbi:MAG: hypothetical protein ACQERR_07275 [Pseudomonadota bacterium]